MVVWEVVALVLPVVAAAALLRAGASDRLLTVAPLTVVPTVLLAVVPPWTPQADDVLRVDPTARPLLFAAAVLYLATLPFAARAVTVSAERLTGLLLVSFAATSLLLQATDIATFTIGCAILTATTYRVIVLHGTDAARRAGRLFGVLGAIGGGAVATAAIMIAGEGGWRLSEAPRAVAESSQSGAIIGLLLVGFAMMAAVFPVHGWLPLAESRVTVPVGAVLSGMFVKVGLVGWLRLLPLGDVAAPTWSAVVITVSLVGAFVSLVPGVLNDDPEVSLGYSTVAQMGFIGVVVGVALGVPEAAEACVLSAVLYAVHHASAKGALVLSGAVWEHHGAGRLRWIVLAGIALLGLAVAGAPLGSGKVAKYAAKSALSTEPFVLDLLALLPFVATVSTILLVRAAVVQRAHARPRAERAGWPLVAWVVLGVGGTAATWVLAHFWSDVLAVPSFAPVTIWQATWPILLGLAIAAAVALAARAGLVPRRLRELLVPRGDLLAFVERWLVRRG